MEKWKFWCNALRDNRLLYTMYIFKRRGQPLQDSHVAINAYKSLLEHLQQML